MNEEKIYIRSEHKPEIYIPFSGFTNVYACGWSAGAPPWSDVVSGGVGVAGGVTGGVGVFPGIQLMKAVDLWSCLEE